jgi:hypothetical protein
MFFKLSDANPGPISTKFIIILKMRPPDHIQLTVK